MRSNRIVVASPPVSFADSWGKDRAKVTNAGQTTEAEAKAKASHEVKVTIKSSTSGVGTANHQAVSVASGQVARAASTTDPPPREAGSEWAVGMTAEAAERADEHLARKNPVQKTPQISVLESCVKSILHPLYSISPFNSALPIAGPIVGRSDH
jgi:hypothetical protein